MNIPPPPPPFSALPTDALAQVFANTASSHKFLWTLAILDILSLPKFRDADRPAIPMKLLVCHMLNTAMGTLECFRLQQFSRYDKFQAYLELCRQQSGIFRQDYSLAELDKVCGRIPRSVYTPLVSADAAPYRFLVPFVNPDIRVNMTNIRREAQQLAESDSPAPYYFSDNRSDIIVHPRWREYFAANADIVRGWVLWHWARFLETRNPSTPSLSAKITGVVRGSLVTPRKLWDAVILRAPGEVRCIYSGMPLEVDNYSVDHYLPWEFIGHDNFWNLAPTIKEVNSSKGDKLPDAKYLEKLAGIHGAAIAAYHERADLRRACGSLMLAYFTDLQVSAHDAPPNEGDILGAYQRVVPALMSLAENQGFKSGWQHRKKKQTS